MRAQMIKLMLTFWLSLIMTLFSFNTAVAAIDVYEFDTPQQEAQYRGLIAEFRCPKCQNQNLAGSDAPIAQDLKQKTYEMVKAGQSDAQIREYMYDRYGDFISYKPPVRPSTWILWFFPPLLLLMLIAGWIWRTKRQSRVATVLTMTSTQTTLNQSDNVGLNSSESNMASTIDSDAQQSEQSDVSDIASTLTAEEKQALAALLAENDDISNNSTKQSEDMPDKGDK